MLSVSFHSPAKRNPHQDCHSSVSTRLEQTPTSSSKTHKHSPPRQASMSSFFKQTLKKAVDVVVTVTPSTSTAFQPKPLDPSSRESSLTDLECFEFSAFEFNPLSPPSQNASLDNISNTDSHNESDNKLQDVVFDSSTLHRSPTQQEDFETACPFTFTVADHQRPPLSLPSPQGRSSRMTYAELPPLSPRHKISPQHQLKETLSPPSRNGSLRSVHRNVDDTDNDGVDDLGRRVTTALQDDDDITLVPLPSIHDVPLDTPFVQLHITGERAVVVSPRVSRDRDKKGDGAKKSPPVIPTKSPTRTSSSRKQQQRGSHSSSPFQYSSPSTTPITSNSRKSSNSRSSSRSGKHSRSNSTSPVGTTTSVEANINELVHLLSPKASHKRDSYLKQFQAAHEKDSSTNGTCNTNKDATSYQPLPCALPLV
jgi:hypothetical protein